MMTFLHPFILWGTLAVAIPVIIHLIHKKRAVLHKFAAIEFVIRSSRKTAKAFKIKQFLLLLMRMLIMLSITIMAARLVTLPNITNASSNNKPQSVVIILDNSYSMGCEHEGMKLFAKAVKRTKNIVQTLKASDDATVIPLVETSTKNAATLTYDKSKLLDIIESIKLSKHFAMADSALERAASILKTSAKKAHKIVYVSDFATNGWDFSSSPFAGIKDTPEIELNDVRENAQCKNATIESLEVLPDYSTGKRQWRVSVRIKNSSNTAIKRLKISLSLDSVAIANGFVDIAPKSDADKVFTIKITKAGDHILEAIIAKDSLKIDNRRIAPLSVPPIIRVLIVNGQPSTTSYKDELFYLRNALNPQGLGLSGIKFSEITPDQLIKPDFSSFDVIFLCNVPTLPDVAVNSLKTFVQKGGGLFISAGNALQPDFYNSRLIDLLPGTLRTPKAPGGTDAAAYKITIGIAPFNPTDHSITAVFDNKSKKAMLSARFSKFLPFNPNPKKNKRIILRYTNEQPLLVESGFGEGSVFLFTSTIDRDWSDFPIRTAFLPLIQESVKYLSRSTATKMPAPLTVGTTAKLRVPPNTTKAILVYPSEEKSIKLTFAKQNRTSSEKYINIPKLYENGVYTLKLIGSDINLKLIVNIDPSEGDLSKLSKDDLLSYLKSAAGDKSVITANMSGKLEFAHKFALMLFLALLFEALLMRSLTKRSH